MNNQDFGRFIHELRKEKGLTQRELAEKINVSDKAVSRWENGKNYPDIEILDTLSKTLGVSISELLNCKRVTQEEAFALTEQAYIGEVKRNRKNKSVFIAIIAVILSLAVFATGYLILNPPVNKKGYSEQDIEMYSSDISSILKNTASCIKVDCDSDDYIITEFEIECDSNKNAELINLDGNCTSMHRHYSQSLSDEDVLSYCKVYKSNFKIDSLENGISISTLINLADALDFKQLDKNSNADSKYSLLMGVSGQDYNCFINEFSENKDYYMLKGNALTKLDGNYELKGTYTELHLFKRDSDILAIIFTECN